MKKRIPIGIDDFDNLIKENYYFADKSLFIKSVMEAEDAKIILLPRPRRFGKSLNMSMMKYFLTNKNAEKNRELFKGLLIEKESTMEKQGKYPVIYISFKDVKELNWENCYRSSVELLKTLFREYQYLLEKIDEFDRDDF
ncbi:MAG: AAA family ATPase, partial [Patescibacteria group bacterium]